VDKALAKIRKLKGLEDAAFDIAANLKKIYSEMGPDEVKAQDLRAGSFSNCLDYLAQGLERHWKDDMVSEALLEIWANKPHQILFTYTKEKCSEVKEGTVAAKATGYHGVRIFNGNLEIIFHKWYTNTQDVSYFDFISVL